MAGGTVGFVWDVPPSEVAQACVAYGARILAATTRAADILARMVESYARANAPWQDQTGAARAGLVAVAERASQFLVIIYLFHTVEYGKWLEIAMGMRYQIINPALIYLYPLVFTIIRQEIGG